MKVSFTDQNSQSIEIKDRITLTLIIIKWHSYYMHYSIDSKDWIYVKGYRFLFFAKNIGKNLSSKYSQKFLDKAKKLGATKTYAIKSTSKWAIQKTAEATGDLIGNKLSLEKASNTAN